MAGWKKTEVGPTVDPVSLAHGGGGLALALMEVRRRKTQKEITEKEKAGRMKQEAGSKEGIYYLQEPNVSFICFDILLGVFKSPLLS